MALTSSLIFRFLALASPLAHLKTMKRFVLTVILFFSSSISFLSGQDPTYPEPRWWKGNTHTHSLWSDGDDFPEMITEWYAKRDYNFLALSDHNILSEGLRWMSYDKIKSRGGDEIFDKYLKRFGPHWVETRGEKETKAFEVRLKPIEEYRALVEQNHRFILIAGEEITDKFENKPVHINAINLAEKIEPLGGKSVREVMENNLRSVYEQEKRLGRSMLPHLNHPNFKYGISYEDLAAVVSERFFEVYNGHPDTNHLGDDKHPGIESMWDLANAIRLTVLDAPPLLGIGTDDSHEYHGKPGSRPGRGWVMVRSRFLTPEHLIQAMKVGDFYASSGVTLKDVAFNQATKTLRIEVAPDSNATYRIDFIATLKATDDDRAANPIHAKELPPKEKTGQVVSSKEGTVAEYVLTGNELYVRAVITSNLPPADPIWNDQKQQAWTQPIGF
jgi:hypothetical protein